MRKLTLIILSIILVASIATAGMTKVYIGSQDGQFILGVEARAIDSQVGMVGIDLRSVLESTITKVNGYKFIDKPSQFITSFNLAGLDEQGTIYNYELAIKNVAKSLNGLSLHNSLGTKIGTGKYILYE